MNHYDKFRKVNKIVYADGDKATIVSVNFEQDTCICANSDRKTYYLLPIELLLSDMENDMCHINNFTRLRNWKGFEDENVVHRCGNAYYPNDYLENQEKYVVDVTKYVPSNFNFTEIYKNIGAKISCNYYDNVSECEEEQESQEEKDEI